MSLRLTELIGKNIKQHREKSQMSQKDLASKVNVTRPVISNWENGKSEPSSSQLVQLSKVFNISTDEIVGNTADIKSAVIVDTSALIKRPRIVEELNLVFNEVIIPEVVIAELNNLKDNNNKPAAVKQKAWLVMKSITDKGDSFTIAQNIRHEGKNDEKIAEIALQRAKSKPYDHVYVLTDDIWFQFLTKEQSNLEAITPALYAERFLQTHKESNPTKNIEFYSLVKAKKLAEVKAFDLVEVDINIHDPDSGLTPLIQAVRNRDMRMIDYLISLRDIDLDCKDKQKYCFSAVHHATQLKRIDIIKKLGNAGADIDIGSGGKNSGNTPLMVAAWSAFIEGVKYFTAQNACTNQQDGNGYTPLMKAVIKHNSSIVEHLLPLTDLNIRSRENKRAVEYVEVNKKDGKEIADLFKEVEYDR